MTSLLIQMAPYELESSWAVWPTTNGPYDRKSDISFPTTGLDTVLHNRTVIIALNRGKASENLQPHQTFHTGNKHNDHLLAEAFRDTAHWGGYMTDLMSQIESKSAAVDMAHGRVSEEVADFVREMQLLGVVDPLFIVLGGKAQTVFDNHESEISDSLRLDKLRWVAAPHYSGSASGKHKNDATLYRELVHGSINNAGH